MKLNIDMLRKGLGEWIAQDYTSSNYKDFMFSLIQLVLPNQTHFPAGRIYIADEQYLTHSPTIESPIIMISTGTRAKEAYESQCAFFSCALEAGQIYEEVLKIKSYYNEFERSLQNVLLQRQDIQALTDLCSVFFGNPCIMISTGHRVLAISKEVVPSTPDEDWAYMSTFRRFPEYVMDNMKMSNQFPVLLKVKTAALYNHDAALYPCAFINFFDGDKHLGRILVCELLKPCDEITLCVLNQIKHYFEYFIMYRNQHRLADISMDVYFLSEMIAGRMQDQKLINNQLTSMNWQMNDRYVVLYIKMQDMDVKSQTRDYTIQLLQGCLQDSCVFPFESDLVAIIRTFRHSLYEIVTEINPILRDSNFRAGMSNVFSDFSAVRTHFLQAHAAVEVGVQCDDTQRLYRYNSHAIEHLLLSAMRTADSQVFMHPAVEALAQHDKNNDTDYFPTLKAYLDKKCSTVETADALHIHRNTLLYRIDKIEKLVDVDWNDPKERLHLQLSYAMYTCKDIKY